MSHRNLLKTKILKYKKILLKKNIFLKKFIFRNGITLFYCATGNGHIEIVTWLQSNGSVLNKKDKGGNSVLHVVAGEGHLKIVQLFIQKRLTLSNWNHAKETPLVKAKKANHHDLQVEEINKAG